MFSFICLFTLIAFSLFIMTHTDSMSMKFDTDLGPGSGISVKTDADCSDKCKGNIWGQSSSSNRTYNWDEEQDKRIGDVNGDGGKAVHVPTMDDLLLFSPKEMDVFEESDMQWLGQYARLRAMYYFNRYMWCGEV